MSVTFSLSNGELLNSKSGLPEEYDGPVVAGTHASYIKAPFGQVVMQRFRSQQIWICYTVIKWKRAEKLICDYNFSPGLFSRTMLHGSIQEVIKGAGDIHQRSDQYMMLAGSKWNGVLHPEKPAEHHYIEIWWSNKFFTDTMGPEYPRIGQSQGGVEGLPHLLTTLAYNANAQMKSLTESLMYIQFKDSTDSKEFTHLLEKYLRLVLSDIKDELSLKRKIGESNWFILTKAKKLIDYNLDKKYTTIEISIKVGVNDFKLKKLFPKLTGYNVDEYRRYKLFIVAARKIVEDPDEPLKSISNEAGYTSVGTFIRAFRTLCHCTPGELRDDTWDITKVKIKPGAYAIS